VHHDSFWWYHDGNRAIRVGDWKLVADHQSPWELYDLRKDRSESTDLAAKYPDRVKEMERTWTAQMEAFCAQVRREAPPQQ
jgi:arylsulfatase